MSNKIERIKMVKAMEFIARQLNDEEILLDDWFNFGVGDGEIPLGQLSVEANDFDGCFSIAEWYADDTRFAELMHTFLRCMKAAYKSGGLYCDGVVSKKSGK